MFGYGSTEAGTVAYAPALRLQGFDNAVGITCPWVHVEIVNEDKNPCHQAARERFAFALTGRAIATNAVSPTTKSEIDRSEWFYPGDRGILYKNGILVILGRLHDIINRGGVKIAPEAIEEFAKTIEGVGDAAAVGVLSQLGVEQIWLAVITDPTVDVEVRHLYEAFRSRMPNSIPDRIYSVPTGAAQRSGKVVRPELQRTLRELEATATGTAGFALPLPDDGAPEKGT